MPSRVMPFLGVVTDYGVLYFSTVCYATMWSAAALANLAASYCNTKSGHCY